MSIWRVAVVALTIPVFACGGDTPPPKVSPDPTPSVAPTPSVTASVAVADAAVVVVPAVPPMADFQLTALRSAADAINHHDPAKYAELFTTNAIYKEAAARDIIGQHGIADRMSGLFLEFLDFKVSFDRVWLKNNIAVVEWHWTGTDNGYMGKKATRRHAGLQGVSVAFFNTDGRIREIHVYEDGQNVVSQLDANAKAGSFRPAPSDLILTTEVIPSNGGPNEGTGMSTAKAFYDAIETKKEADAAALFAADATVDDYALAPRTTKGPDAWKAMSKTWASTFTNFTELPLYNLMTVNDYVIVERVLKGTMSAGSGVSLHCLDIAQLKDGKIIRFRSWSNTLELVSQVGARGLRKG